MVRKKSLFEWLFKDKERNVVIGQAPNWPLYATLGFYLLRFTSISYLEILSLWGTKAFLLYWAYLELTQGVNGYRKILGAAVISWIIVTTIIEM